ncbi:hypothetical protein ACBJ59_16315 [Nonomuraea sp. MTCD27]|uniref:hypothetical protein n=1 Tax=Nonomuraea sp. MTCD27 TaxID=1676747 RepID=UPI0035BF5796
MDENPYGLRERFEAMTGDASPSPGLHARIIAAAAARRRSRRYGILAGAAALLVAAVLLPSLAPRTEPDEIAAVRTPTEPPGLIAPDAPKELHAFLRPDPPARIPVRTRDGRYFRVDALGEMGTVLGGTGFDADPYRATDDRLWLATPSDPVPAVAAATAPQSWARAAGSELHAWAEPRGGAYDYQLMCVQSGSTPRQVGTTGVTKGWPHPIRISGDVLVWTDETDVVRAATGCAGEPRELRRSGRAVAFSHPYAYVADGRRLLRVDVRGGGAESTVAELPDGSVEDRPVIFAAAGDTVTWVAGRVLTVLAGRERRQVSLDSALAAQATDLTVGGRLVVLAARPAETDPSHYAALVYDLRTGDTVRLAAEAYAADGWLLWRERDAYSLARVAG